MTRLRPLVLLVFAVLIGCADGGPIGSGISSLSAISGNVVAVDSGAPQARSSTAVAAVQVSIDGIPGLETTTDEGGNFELSGDFAGTVTLRFRTADLTATQEVDVPDNANVVLQDIVVSSGQVRIEAARVVGFYGHVTLVDCRDGTLLVNDRRPAPNQFLIRITEDTVLVRGDGRPLRCAEISPGNAIAIEGIVRFVDRTISALTLTIGPPPPGNRLPIIEVRFRGSVLVANCRGAMLMLADPTIGRTRLRLTEQTVIRGPDGETLECGDIQLNDRAEGRGTINVRRPEVVEALNLLILPPR